MFAQLTVGLNIVTLILLLFILYKVKSSIDQQTNYVLFGRVLYATAFFSALALVEVFLASRSGKIFLILHLNAECIRSGFSGIISCLWFIYILSDSDKNRRWIYHKKNFHIILLPAYIFGIFTFIGIGKGLVVGIDMENEDLVKGPFFSAQAIITYGYYTAASFITLLRLLQGKFSKSTKVTKTLFVLLPMTAGIIHMLFPQLVVIWTGLALLLAMEYIDFQEEKVSHDGLTKLNNRRSFDSFLKQSITGQYFSVYLFMIDIDYFKHINDTYGHLEGDNSLIEVSRTLQYLCSEKKAFLARFGGDEFAIILMNASLHEAQDFKNEIYLIFASKDDMRTSDGRSYRIHISAGFARENSANIEEILKNADEALYIEKEKNHINLKHIL